MEATEFEIIVADRTVRGTVSQGPSPENELDVPEVDLDVDELSMGTVALMDKWLNFYTLITRKAEIRHSKTLFERKTFEVLGQQLWRLILLNDIGDKLAEYLDNLQNEPLRLVLTFTNQADAELRGLPWEFLYHPRHGFLARKTGLLLTRYVDEERDDRPTVTPVDKDQLRVLLLAALPDDRGRPAAERRFAGAREDLQALWKQLKAIDQLDALEPIYSWNDREVSDAVSAPNKPCHIVHVIGICRGTPGHPRLWLAGESDDFQDDPQQLVDRLTGSTVPQLVILQLYDYGDGDASENFERLAPALIAKGVPAVLALQYAASADDGGVGVAFYKALIEGKQVGEAVQASRETLAKTTIDRRFATPVLYLGNDGVLWPRSRPQSQAQIQSRPSGQPNRPPRRPRDFEIKMFLSRAIQGDSTLDAREELLDWVTGLHLGDAATTNAKESIRLKLKEVVDVPTRDALGRMLDELVRYEQAI